MRAWAFQEGGRGQEVKGRIREVEGSRESATVLWGPPKGQKDLGGVTWLGILPLWASFFPIKSMGWVGLGFRVMVKSNLKAIFYSGKLPKFTHSSRAEQWPSPHIHHPA